MGKDLNRYLISRSTDGKGKKKQIKPPKNPHQNPHENIINMSLRNCKLKQRDTTHVLKLSKSRTLTILNAGKDVER